MPKACHPDGDRAFSTTRASFKLGRVSEWTGGLGNQNNAGFADCYEFRYPSYSLVIVGWPTFICKTSCEIRYKFKLNVNKTSVNNVRRCSQW